MKKLFIAILLICASCFAALLLLEAAMYFTPVDYLDSLPVNDANPMLRFTPNEDYTWSKGADFHMVNTVHSNNYGFINDQDYVKNSEKPLVAIIGDSYVEAMMVPYGQTIHGRLSKQYDEFRFYSFARSGAPLSQYLAVAEYVKQEFAPIKMIFVVVGNDYDESLLRYKSAGGFHYFTEDDDAHLHLTRRDWTPSWKGNIIKSSKLLIYLLRNVQIQRVPGNIQQMFARKQEQYVGNTETSTNPRRMSDSQKAVDEFLSLLPEYSGLKPSDILFLVDALRPHIYDGYDLKEVEDSYFARMREYFMHEAVRKGYVVEDMQPRFIRLYKENGNRFEYTTDQHWNGYGHAAAAQAVKESGILQNMHK